MRRVVGRTCRRGPAAVATDEPDDLIEQSSSIAFTGRRWVQHSGEDARTPLPFEVVQLEGCGFDRLCAERIFSACFFVLEVLAGASANWDEGRCPCRDVAHVGTSAQNHGT